MVLLTGPLKPASWVTIRQRMDSSRRVRQNARPHDEETPRPLVTWLLPPTARPACGNEVLLTCNASTNYNRPGSRSKKSTVTHLIWTWAMQVQWFSFKYCGVLWNYHGSSIIQYSIYGMGPFDIQFCMRKLHLPGLNYIYFSWMSAWSSSVLTGDDWPHNSQTATRPIYPPETADPSYGPTAPVRSTS